MLIVTSLKLKYRFKFKNPIFYKSDFLKKYIFFYPFTFSLNLSKSLVFDLVGHELFDVSTSAVS